MEAFREAAAGWMDRRLGVQVNGIGPGYIATRRGQGYVFGTAAQ